MRHCIHTYLTKAFSIFMLVSICFTASAAETEEVEPDTTEQTTTETPEIVIDDSMSNEELAAEIQKELDEDYDVVTFYGTKPPGFYRRQFQLAELDFYKKFNDYVDVNKFRISCRKERPLGSRVGYTVCYPQYLLTRVARESNLARNAGLPLPSIDQVQRTATTEREEFAKYSEELVKKHPELAAKLIEFGKAKKAYDDVKAGN